MRSLRQANLVVASTVATIAWLQAAFATTGQEVNVEVDPITCSNWDHGVVSLFHLWWIVILLGSLVGGLLGATVLSGWFWLWTRPVLRVVVAGVAVTVLVAAVFWLWPVLFGFGSGIFTAIPPDYAQCSGRGGEFNASGVLWGVVGNGIAAVDLALWMFLLNILAGIAGVVAALLLNKFLLWALGLRPAGERSA